MTKFEKGFTYYSTEFGGFSFELGEKISDGKYSISVEWFHIPCSGDGIIYLTNDNTIGFVMVNNGCRAYGAPSFSGDAFVKVTPTYFVPSHILKK